jgi:hypothetical protein
MMSRMPRILAVAILVWMAAAAAPAAATAFDDEGYLRVADRFAQRVIPAWSPEAGYYVSGSPALDSRLNAAMLVVHAAAARYGHEGPSRDDGRARQLVRALTSSPPFFDGPAPPWPDPMFHTPGWLGNLAPGYSVMDKAIDPKIAEGLAAAWQARAALNLDPATTTTIANEISAVAHGPFFRFPNVRLNQINWPLELDAYAAQVTGSGDLLRDEYRLQMDRFLTDGHNLSPSFRFQYLPQKPPSHFFNLDSAEYANIVLHFLAFYDDARRAGMGAPPPAETAVLRGWVRRALFGYWTHSGMLNWDTGLGLKRWMKGKTWAYAQQGLLAIASAARFQADPRYRGWAKWMFDRGLELGLTVRSSNLYGVRARTRAISDDLMFAARMAANAARAADAGLGRMAGAEPPPFFAFDPDMGRLAVSTPKYSTAVVPVNRHAFAYGGIELARLFDSRGRPLSGIGGIPPNAFGIVIRDHMGRGLLASQQGLEHDPARPPLTLPRAPRRPGPFHVLEAVGKRRGGGFSITTRHRFTSSSIGETWTIKRRKGHADAIVVLQLPSWGAATVPRAVLAGGGRVPIRDRPLPLAKIRRLDLSGYSVRLRARHGSVRAVATSPQSTDPDPGPTLELALAAGRRFRHAGLRAQIVAR